MGDFPHGVCDDCESTESGDCGVRDSGVLLRSEQFKFTAVSGTLFKADVANDSALNGSGGWIWCDIVIAADECDGWSDEVCCRDEWE